MNNQKPINNLLKDPRTNWNYILIVVVLGILVGGGILGYYYSWIAELETKIVELEVRVPEKAIEDETADLSSEALATEDWKTYRNEEYGFELLIPLHMSESLRGKFVLESGKKYNVVYRVFNIEQNRQDIISNIINGPYGSTTKSLAQDYVNATADNDILLSYEILEADLLCGQTEVCYQLENYQFLKINGYPSISFFAESYESHFSTLASNKIYRFWFGGQPEVFLQNKTEFEMIIKSFKPKLEEVPVDETADWKSYRSSRMGFSIRYPVDWRLDSRGIEKFTSIAEAQKVAGNHFFIFSYSEDAYPPGGPVPQNELKIEIWLYDNLTRTLDEWVNSLGNGIRVEDMAIDGKNAKKVWQKYGAVQTFSVLYIDDNKGAVFNSWPYNTKYSREFNDIVTTFRFSQ